ncbi:MAG: ABC transporter permease, partial [Acidobacteriota bacterium]|nr:ABC transporter permease [Acidobacteriota bacterium]
MTTLWQDLRYGVRTLLKRPSFATLAVLVLALGIGANSAIFSVINAVLLRPLPYMNPERIVVPVSTNAERGFDNASVPYADFLDWKNEEQLFEHVAVFQQVNLDLTGDGEPERIQGVRATEGYFDVTGLQSLVGRRLLPEDHQPGGAAVAVISDGLWQRRFGGEKEIVGRIIALNGRKYTVVGVMPSDTSVSSDATDVWVPLTFESGGPSSDILRRDNFIWQSIALLKQDVSLAQANAKLEAVARRIEGEHSQIRKGWSTQAVPLNESIVGTQLRRALFVLFGAVGFVLLIACVNVANLLLARAAVREREMAIRIALGAGRWRLIRQLLIESLVLALVGGVCGLLLALWGVDIITTLAPADMPRLKEIGIDRNVLVFVAGVSLLTSLLFGIVPALHASRTNLNESLKEGGGGRGSTAGVHGQRARNALVVAEIALSLVLLVSAGLMVKSFVVLQQVDPGFRVDNLLTLQLNLPRARYGEDRRVVDTVDRILEKLKSQPGVNNASAVTALPLGGGGFYLGRVFLEEGRPEPPAGPDHQAEWNVVSPGFFTTMGIAVLRGRAFDDRDDENRPPAIIINETMARRMFPNEDALGKRIRSWRDENKYREVVGVVRDVRYYGRDDKPRGLVYVPLRQDVWRSLILAVRTDGDPVKLSSDLRNQIWGGDQDLALANITTMQQTLVASTARPRFSTLLLSVFASVALVLAAVGLYGVM